MIGGACVLVRLYQTWAGHQGNENPVAIDEIKRIQWLAMMRQLASLRDIILEGGQNHHELPRLLIPRMRQNLLDLNHLLNMFANWETCMTNYEWIFQQVQRLATIRGLFAWEIRHEALLCLEDCHYSGYKPAKQFLVDLEERARAVQVRWQNVGWPAAPTHVYTPGRGLPKRACPVAMPCRAVGRRLCMGRAISTRGSVASSFFFFPERAPTTPSYEPSDSSECVSDSSESVSDVSGPDLQSRS